MEIPDFDIFDDKTSAIEIFVDRVVGRYQRKIYEAKINTIINEIKELRSLKQEIDQIRNGIEESLDSIKNQRTEIIIRKLLILSLNLTCIQTNIESNAESLGLLHKIELRRNSVSHDHGETNEHSMDLEDIEQNKHANIIVEKFDASTYMKLQLNDLLYLYRWEVYSSGVKIDLTSCRDIVKANFSGDEAKLYLDFMDAIEANPFHCDPIN